LSPCPIIFTCREAINFARINHVGSTETEDTDYSERVALLCDGYTHRVMDARLRVVTRIPLEELWREDGFTTRARGRRLTVNDVRELLRTGTVQFVVADVGESLDWIPPSDRFTFWKQEVKRHLSAPDSRAPLEEHLGHYCYFASEWNGDTMPIILLEKHH
jgi:hypothetical protein